MSTPATATKETCFRALIADFHGNRVVLATKDGDARPSVVTVDSIESCLGSAASPMGEWLRSREYAVPVLYDGWKRSLYVVDLKIFYHYCMAHPSPQLETFREHLAEIAESVQNHGGYIEPAGPALMLNPLIANDPTMQMLQAIAEQTLKATVLERESRKHSQEINQIKQQVGQIEQQINLGSNAWTVSAWLSRHGIPHSSDFACEEGKRLRRICDSRGIRILDQKVCNGSGREARMWPREAIDIWWPEFQRRDAERLRRIAAAKGAR